MKLCRTVALLTALMPGAHAGTVLTADGTLREGELGIDHGITVRLPKATVKLAVPDILRARFAATDGLFQPGLVLVNGARIAGEFSALDGGTVKIGTKHIAIPAKLVAWATYRPFGTDLVAQIPRGRAGALLPGGDFMEGSARGGDATIAKVLSPIFGPRAFAATELHALVIREIQPQPAAFDVLTRDGSIYPALDITAGESEITLRHPLYNGLRIRLADLVEIRASASRMLPLDAVRPTRVDPAAGRDAANCFAANRALGGGPLKLGALAVDAGFDCVTGSTAWWEPPPGAGTFLALVAAGADTPAGQKLTFTVYADRKLVGKSKPLAAGDSPAVLRCAVPGAESLVLRIEGGGGSGTWAEPVLLRH